MIHNRIILPFKRDGFGQIKRAGHDCDQGAADDGGRDAVFFQNGEFISDPLPEIYCHDNDGEHLKHTDLDDWNFHSDTSLLS